jgi:hypothetical protein
MRGTNPEHGRIGTTPDPTELKRAQVVIPMKMMVRRLVTKQSSKPP